jgi:hypothetical protein
MVFVNRRYVVILGHFEPVLSNLRTAVFLHHHHKQQQLLLIRPRDLLQYKISSEIMNQLDIWQDSLGEDWPNAWNGYSKN